MLTYYDLEGYQRKGTEHQLALPGNAIWADMGLGKTVTTATTLLELKERANMRRALVIAPYRVARSTWQNELNLWEHLHSLTCTVAVGPEFRGLALNPTTDITTINIENVPWLIKHFREKGSRFKMAWPYDVVVVDEAQQFRTRGVRFLALMRVRSQIERLMELSGTPAPRGLINLWTQMALLDQGESLGYTITGFRDRWFDPPNPMYGIYDYMPKQGAKAEITGLIKHLVFSLSERDYLDLPEVRYNPIRIAMPPAARAAYMEMKRKAVLYLRTNTITAANAGVVSNKLLQICNGAVYDRTGEWHEVDDYKVKAFGDFIEEQDDKNVMALFGYKHDQERLEAELKLRKIRYRVLNTQKDEDDWNTGKIRVLLLHPASGGHGLNLQGGGEVVLWFGLTANLEWYQQANARLMGGHRRKGKNVVVNCLIGEDTVELRMLDILTAREEDQDDITAVFNRIILEE